jgi:DNA-binding transcriptional regulator LsrR (DeoR family)
MFKHRRGEEREELLADVAEMYYDEGRTQDEIAAAFGMTRSAISRMLSEARQKGIVEIHVRRPLRRDTELETELMRRFGLRGAHVLTWKKSESYEGLRARLGLAAAQVLSDLIAPDMVIGLPWGRTVSATIDALTVREPIAVKVVQLVGVLGSGSHAYNAQALVEQLARKLGGEGVYLYTPFIVESEETVRALLNNQHIRQAIETGRRCSIALLGVGTTDPQYSSLYQGGHISLEQLEALRAAGAVGDVSGHHFDINGHAPEIAFHNYLVGIARDDLLMIPTRLGVAGGQPKVRPILGALRGGFVNMLVTDSGTAAQVLALDETPG